MSEEPKSLLPYDDNYVLIHKRTLVVNTAVNSRIAELLSKKCGFSAEGIVECIGISIIEYVADLSDDKVSTIVKDLIAESWRNQDREKSRPFVSVEDKNK